MKDDLLHGLRDCNITNIKYHVNTCYADYWKEKDWLEWKRNDDTSSSTPLLSKTVSPNPTCSRAKKTKTVGHQIPHVKNCIICNQKKCQGDRKKNYASVKQGKQSSSFFLSAIKPLMPYLLLTWCIIKLYDKL